MKTPKIVKRARRAKELGYTHLASIIKSGHNARYYHVVLVSDVIDAGRWIPAKRPCVGIHFYNINWQKTIRRDDVILDSEGQMYYDYTATVIDRFGKEVEHQHDQLEYLMKAKHIKSVHNAIRFIRAWLKKELSQGRKIELDQFGKANYNPKRQDRIVFGNKMQIVVETVGYLFENEDLNYYFAWQLGEKFNIFYCNTAYLNHTNFDEDGVPVLQQPCA